MTIKDETLKEVIGGQTDCGTVTTQTTGLKCPSCGAFIQTNIFQIRTAAAIVCPCCGLRMNIDRLDSRKALDALRKVQTAQENVGK